jgi:uncharacterized OB-fold protein
VPSCPACGAESEPTRLGPEATLVGFTRVLHQPPDARLNAPYAIAVAGFPAANLGVLGLLVEPGDPDAVVLGSPLRVCVYPDERICVYGFRFA